MEQDADFIVSGSTLGLRRTTSSATPASPTAGIEPGPPVQHARVITSRALLKNMNLFLGQNHNLLIPGSVKNTSKT